MRAAATGVAAAATVGLAVPLTAAGCGTGLDVVAAGTGRAAAAAAGLLRCASLLGCPFGPPGLSNLPCVIARPGTLLALGVGRDTLFAGSPWFVWIVPDLYRSSRATMLSLSTLTAAGLPGFLLYSILR